MTMNDQQNESTIETEGMSLDEAMGQLGTAPEAAPAPTAAVATETTPEDWQKKYRDLEWTTVTIGSTTHKLDTYKVMADLFDVVDPYSDNKYLEAVAAWIKQQFNLEADVSWSAAEMFYSRFVERSTELKKTVGILQKSQDITI
jgi:hypothetical protein